MSTTITTEYRGHRICGDICPAHSVEHYSGGDTIIAESLRSGARRIWRAWGPDHAGRTTVAIHASGRAWLSEGAAMAAVDAAIPAEHLCDAPDCRAVATEERTVGELVHRLCAGCAAEVAAA